MFEEVVILIVLSPMLSRTRHRTDGFETVLVGIEPVHERGPAPQERFVRHLHHLALIAGFSVGAKIPNSA